jgi:hypothetical protein
MRQIQLHERPFSTLAISTILFVSLSKPNGIHFRIAFHVDSSFNADKILYINRFTQTGNNMINWKLFKYHQE